MSVIKLEPSSSQETREQIREEVLKCDSCLIIYNNRREKPTYSWVAMGEPEAIALLELIKRDILNEIASR